MRDPRRTYILHQESLVPAKMVAIMARWFFCRFGFGLGLRRFASFFVFGVFVNGCVGSCPQHDPKQNTLFIEERLFSTLHTLDMRSEIGFFFPVSYLSGFLISKHFIVGSFLTFTRFCFLGREKNRNPERGSNLQPLPSEGIAIPLCYRDCLSRSDHLSSLLQKQNNNGTAF